MVVTHGGPFGGIHLPQQLDDLGVVVLHRILQRRLPPSVEAVHDQVARLEQLHHHTVLAEVGREVERGAPVVVALVEIGPLGERCRDRGDVTELSRVDEQSCT